MVRYICFHIVIQKNSLNILLIDKIYKLNYYQNAYFYGEKIIIKISKIS